MAKYIKKPIIVDAIKYEKGLEDGVDEIETAIQSGLDINKYVNPLHSDKVPYIRTLEGKHYISKGDYIITGVEGERYPCKEKIFLSSYKLYK
jgi:hypothetical protein